MIRLEKIALLNIIVNVYVIVVATSSIYFLETHFICNLKSYLTWLMNNGVKTYFPIKKKNLPTCSHL